MRDAGRWEWLVLLFLLVPLLAPGPATAPLLLVMPASFAWRRLCGRPLFQRTPLDISLLILAIMLLVSLAATFDMALSFPKIAGLVSGIALFYATQELGRSQSSPWPIVAVVLLAGVGIAALGLAGSQWSGLLAPLNRLRTMLPTSLQQVPGTRSGFINPNELAGTLGWIAPLAFAATWASWQKRQQGHRWGAWFFLSLVATLACSGVLLLTGSRGGILSLTVALGLMALVRFRGLRWPALVIALLGGIALAAFGSEIWPSGSPAVGGTTVDVSLEGRVEIWSRAIYGLQDFPLTGMSMNGFRQVVHVLYPLFLIGPDVDLGHAHNQLLQAGLDLGLPGLVAYLSLWIGAAVLLGQSWRHTARSAGPTRTLTLGLIGSLGAGWTFGLLDAVALGARPGFVFWLLLGLVALMHRATWPDAPGLPAALPPVTDAASVPQSTQAPG